jgi:signal transduction histidine kinase
MKTLQPPRWRPLIAGLMTAAVAGGLAVWMTLDPAPTLVGWDSVVSAVVLTVAVAAAVAWAGAVRVLKIQAATAEDSAQRRVAEAHAAVEQRMAEIEADISVLVENTLPAILQQIRAGASVKDALDNSPQPAAGKLRQVAELVADSAAGARRAQFALSDLSTGTASKLRGILLTQAAALRDLQERYDTDEGLLGELFHLDNLNARAGLVADRVPVLTDRYSGRPWSKPIEVDRIVRGAKSRIGEYQRIVVHSASESAVVGYAAEAVMQTLAEVFDNATRFSAPTENVHVYVETLQSGITVAVDDSGLGFGPHQRAEAEAALSDTPLDFTTITEERRLGLLVVGCLARKYGLTVSLRPSSRGGTAVVILIPQQLITEPDQGTSNAEPAGTSTATTSSSSKAPQESTQNGPTGLPRRERGSTLNHASSVPSSGRSPSGGLARLGDFAKEFSGGSSAASNRGGTSRIGTIPPLEEEGS